MTKTLTATIYVNEVELTGIIDWNVSIHKGKSDVYATTSPSTMNLTMYIMDDFSVSPVNLNDVIYLALDIDGVTATAVTGIVSDISTSLRNYSTSNQILEVSVSLIGSLNYLVNATWYNTNATATVSTYLANIASQLNYQSWAEVSDTLTWGAVDPDITWDSFGGTRFNLLYYTGSYDPTLAIPTGTRTIWQDLADIATSTGGNIYENVTGDIVVDTYPYVPSFTATVEAGDLLAEMSNHESIVDVRNVAVIANNAGTTRTRTDQASVSQYGQQQTELQTLLTSTTECATLGDRIINGLSKTYSSPDHFTVDLMSDTGTLDTLFVELNNGAQITLNGIPSYFSNGTGSAIVAVNEIDINISKQNLFISCSCQDWNVYSASVSWEQIDASYTWASYGVAYPTQTWSDL